MCVFCLCVQVREFSITDVQPYSIQLVWQDESGQEADMEVFPKNHQVKKHDYYYYWRSIYYCCYYYYLSEKDIYKSKNTVL